jgi:hypothetical protein
MEGESLRSVAESALDPTSGLRRARGHPWEMSRPLICSQETGVTADGTDALP